MAYEQIVPVIVPAQEYPVQFYAESNQVRGYPFVLSVEPSRSLAKGIWLNISFWLTIAILSELVQRFIRRTMFQRRFGVITLLLMILVAAIGSSIIATLNRWCKVRSRVIADVAPTAILASDAIPSRLSSDDGDYFGCSKSLVAVSCDASDLQRLVIFKSISMIELTGQVKNADLLHLQRFPNLIWLRLDHVSVGDELMNVGADGSLTLPALPTLQSLSVVRSAYTGAGIAGMPNLRRLELRELEISMDVVAEIAHLKKLVRLVVFGTEFSPYQFDRLSNTLSDCEIIH